MTEQGEMTVSFKSIVPADFKIDHNWEHVKARVEKFDGYPERLTVPDNTTWENLGPSYNPPEYTAEKILEKYNNGVVGVDPEDATTVPHDYVSYEGEVKFGMVGRPLNPKGPTGICGRGILYRWGANFAADPIVTRINENGQFEMIAIKRKDTGEFAIPGGMVDKGERVTETLKRELGEETSADLDFESAVMVYQGYVDDPRNTDNSWMETDAFHLHLDDTDNVTLAAGDDAMDASWRVVNTDLLENLYASHARSVLGAIQIWQNTTGNIVTPNGIVKK